MSGDPEQEYFADGMVEDIITALSRFKWLFVIARNSSFIYKGKAVDVRQVGRELGVRYVARGQRPARSATDADHCTADPYHHRKPSVVDKFDGSLSDVFEIQDSVTASVVGSIAPKLGEAEMETASRKPVENWTSYDHYLRGQKLFHEGNRGQARATREALDVFRKVVVLDPAFGRGYARVASCIQSIRDFNRLSHFGGGASGSPEVRRDRCRTVWR